MTDVAQLLAEFVDELRRGAGVPDAISFVSRAESEADGRELAAQIDTVLTMSASDVRWGADDGSVDPADELLARSIVAGAFDGPVELAVLRGRAGLSRDELAERLLGESGLETSAENRAGFRAWIEALETGGRSVREVGARALSAIAAVVGVAADSIADADDGVLAFRVVEEMGPQADAVAEGIDAVAGMVLEGMSDLTIDDGTAPVNSWMRNG